MATYTRDSILEYALNALCIAKERESLARDTSTVFSEDHTALSFFCEQFFGHEFDLKPDETLRPGGDGGVDFWTRGGAIDVKSFRKPKNLLYPVYKIHQAANFIVLCGFKGFNNLPQLFGYATRAEMRAAPTAEFGYDMVNHYIAAEKLHSMDELHAIEGINEQIFPDAYSFCDGHGLYPDGLNCPGCEREGTGHD